MSKTQQIIIGFMLIGGLFFTLPSSEIKAQSAEDLASEYVQNIIEKKSNSTLDAEILKQPESKIIEAYEPYLSDTLAKVRLAACRIVYKTAYKSEDEALRQRVVSMFVAGLNDKSTGVIGRLLKYLADFKISDYTQESKYKLSMQAREEMPYWHRAIKLTGYLQIEEQTYNYKKIIESTEKLSRKAKWAMQLAMARMGDEESLMQVIGTIKRLGVNDDVVYDIIPDLAYIRQKEAFDYMFEIINSDTKDCNSSNPSNEAPIICAFRVMAVVAPYIEEFPVEASVSGGLITNDYDAALEKVRRWITENSSSYKLITDIY